MELQREKDRVVELTNETKKFKAFKKVWAVVLIQCIPLLHCSTHTGTCRAAREVCLCSGDSLRAGDSTGRNGPTTQLVRRRVEGGVDTGMEFVGGHNSGWRKCR